MTEKIIHTKNEKETAAIAAQIIDEVIDNKVIFIRGELGSGKTVFARALIRLLAQNETLEIPSPTFSLLQTYETKYGEIYHYDLYRLENPEDIYELDWEDAINQHIIIVEWPERLEYLKPGKYLDIEILNVENRPSERHIKICRAI